MKAFRAFLQIVIFCLVTFTAKAGDNPENRLPETWTQYIPMTAEIILPVAGVKSESDIARRSFKTALAWGMDCVVIQLCKKYIRENRPDGSGMNSFPSGHASTAFVGAGLMGQDFAPAYSVCAYGLAAYSGTMRVVHNRHYWWDVAAGAAIGVGCAYAAEGICRVIENRFGPIRCPFSVQSSNDGALALVYRF